jgi:hypothetical protein
MENLKGNDHLLNRHRQEDNMKSDLKEIEFKDDSSDLGQDPCGLM